MNTNGVKFSGKLLERGFWLYVWRIKSDTRVVWYVGRTGDSSSPNAASPFGRLSQHLDLRESATANMLARNLRTAGMNPASCEFELTAIGPLFPEQQNFEQHKPYRDVLAVLEAELAYELKERGFEVLGTHPKRGLYNADLYREVLGHVESFVEGG